MAALGVRLGGPGMAHRAPAYGVLTGSSGWSSRGPRPDLRGSRAGCGESPSPPWITKRPRGGRDRFVEAALGQGDDVAGRMRRQRALHLDHDLALLRLGRHRRRRVGRPRGRRAGRAAGGDPAGRRAGGRLALRAVRRQDRAGGRPARAGGGEDVYGRGQGGEADGRWNGSCGGLQGLRGTRCGGEERLTEDAPAGRHRAGGGCRRGRDAAATRTSTSEIAREAVDQRGSSSAPPWERRRGAAPPSRRSRGAPPRGSRRPPRQGNSATRSGRGSRPTASQSPAISRQASRVGASSPWPSGRRRGWPPRGVTRGGPGRDRPGPGDLEGTATRAAIGRSREVGGPALRAPSTSTRWIIRAPARRSETRWPPGVGGSAAPVAAPGQKTIRERPAVQVQGGDHAQRGRRAGSGARSADGPRRRPAPGGLRGGRPARSPDGTRRSRPGPPGRRRSWRPRRRAPRVVGHRPDGAVGVGDLHEPSGLEGMEEGAAVAGDPEDHEVGHGPAGSSDRAPAGRSRRGFDPLEVGDSLGQTLALAWSSARRSIVPSGPWRGPRGRRPPGRRPGRIPPPRACEPVGRAR